MDRAARIGTAGWSIPKEHSPRFEGDGTHLARYARTLSAVEINSSFYRPHRPGTYERWAASVPPGFRFAVKLPRDVTHERRLVDVDEPLPGFLGQVRHLGEALGPLLVQLPPSLAYTAENVKEFLARLRDVFPGQVACEPRHRSWFSDEVDEQLAHFQVARVAADPAVVPRAAEPGGWRGFTYLRLHGSPEMYRSAYPQKVIDVLARRLRADEEADRERWCIFDNTALGEATRNALELMDSLGRNPPWAVRTSE